MRPPHQTFYNGVKLVDPATRRDLAEFGWSYLSFYGNQEDLVNFAREFGAPMSSRRNGPLVDELRPTARAAANPRSLSAEHGEQAFPFHTDAAYQRIPPRYVLLRIVRGEDSARPTLLLDFAQLSIEEEEMQLLRREVWTVFGARSRFFSPLINEVLVPGHTVLRFDPSCMHPATDGFGVGRSVLDRAIGVSDPVQIRWEKGGLIVIDNWRMLHARPPEPAHGDSNRVLERVLVTAPST